MDSLPVATLTYQKKDDIKCNSTGRSELVVWEEGGVSLALRGGFVGVYIAVMVWREGRCSGKGCWPNVRKRRSPIAAALPASLNTHL